MAQRPVRIVADDAMGGEPRVEGRRVTVLQLHDLVEEQGLAPQAAADRYDLDVAAVYRALAYYHEHPREMTRVRAEREQTIAEHRDRGLTPDDIA